MEFLRWTLSDGAGAIVVENRPNDRKTSLLIDWIELRSFADRFPSCMFAGTPALTKDPQDIQPWGNYPSPVNAYEAGAMVLAQDFELLYKMFPVWAGYYLEIIEKYELKPKNLNYFLPHYSAQSLGEEAISRGGKRNSPCTALEKPGTNRSPMVVAVARNSIFSLPFSEWISASLTALLAICAFV